MKIKADGKGRWELLGAPLGTKLRNVKITTPDASGNAGGTTTYYISGPAQVQIEVEYENGKIETISNIVIEWA